MTSKDSSGAQAWILAVNSENDSATKSSDTFRTPGVETPRDGTEPETRRPTTGDLIFQLQTENDDLVCESMSLVDSVTVLSHESGGRDNLEIQIEEQIPLGESICIGKTGNQKLDKEIYEQLRGLTDGSSTEYQLIQCPDTIVSHIASLSPIAKETVQQSGSDLSNPNLDSQDDSRDPFTDNAEATEVIDAVLERLDESSIQNQLIEGLARQVLNDWTSALAQLETRVTVTREENTRLQQLKQVYELLNPQLNQTASTLDIDSYQGLSPAEVVFMSLLRRAQRTVAEDLSEPPNANPANLSKLFNSEVSVIDDGLRVDPETVVDPTEKDTADLIGHPIGEAVREDSSYTSYQYRCSLDQLRTVVRNRALCFTERSHQIWEKVNPGDIVFISTNGTVSREEIPARSHGLIGCGVIRAKAESEAGWLSSELLGDDLYPYMLSFNHLYLTGDIRDLDLRKPNSELSDSRLEDEFTALTSQAVQIHNSPSASPEATNSMDTVSEDGSINAISIFRILRPNLTEISPFVLSQQFRGTIPDSVLDGLYFPEPHGSRIIGQIEAAVRAGKNILLTGPPGTGKTEIAERVATYLVTNYPNLYTGTRTTTATADWSTFDTIGGYMPDPNADTDQLVFTPGLVTNCFQEESGSPLNEPLIIDELNRAEIDKAFGQLFTALTNKSVTLPFKTENGSSLQLATAEDASTVPSDSEYVIPKSWLMFGTINTYDKASLYEMSYAFMRRFAFIRVDAPEIPSNQVERQALLENYLDCWGVQVTQGANNAQSRTQPKSVDPIVIEKIGSVWYAVNEAIENRCIGPAIIKDILDYLREHRHIRNRGQIDEVTFTDAIITYIFPQLEGVPKRGQIVRNIANTEGVDGIQLFKAAQDMLDLPNLMDSDQ